MAPTKTSTKIANIFGSFGYLSVIIQWLLFCAVIIFPLLEGSTARQFFLPQGHSVTAHPAQATFTLPPAVQIGFGVVAVIFSLIVIIYAIYAIPRSAGRTGRKITQASAATVINHVAAHQPLGAERRSRLTFSITWSVKLVLIVLPFLLSFLPLSATIPLSRSAVTTLGLVCAGFSIFWFTLQYLIALTSHTRPKDIW